MQQKHLDKILDYLKVVQEVYNFPNWGGNGEVAVTQDVINNTRIFFDILQKNIPLEEIPQISDVSPSQDGYIGIEWTKINKEPYYIDLFYVFIKSELEIDFESHLESLGTNLNRTTPLVDELDEQLMIHIHHFS